MREDLGDDDDDGGDEVEGVLGEGEGVDDDEGEYEGDEVDDDDDSIRNDGASREEDDEREETIRFSNGIREAEDLDLRHRFNEDLVFLGDEENGVEARTEVPLGRTSGFSDGDSVTFSGLRLKK